jgi:hypothetical protein
VAADVEHAHEPRVGDEGGAASGVERLRDVARDEDAHAHRAVEDLVGRLPRGRALEVRRERLEDAIPSREHRATSDDVYHQASCGP